MTLIDTSASIEFFSGHEPIAGLVDGLLQMNEAALCGPVITELRRGFRSRSDRARVLLLMKGCRYLAEPDRIWEEAGDLGFVLREKGLQLKTLDLLIASYALAYRCPILSDDRDFLRMNKVGIPLLVLP